MKEYQIEASRPSLGSHFVSRRFSWVNRLASMTGARDQAECLCLTTRAA